MDRIDPIGPRRPSWTAPVDTDPDREAHERRRREAERRRREREAAATRSPQDGDDPPHRIDVRA